MSPSWEDGSDERLAEWRDEYRRAGGKHRGQAPKAWQCGPSLPRMSEDMSTEELLREAAFLRLFQSPEDEARADAEEEEA